ncbi:transketolase-like TK C-terminal-containing protein, partial [Methylobacterium tarhaniae]|uniref:transketolase-like TK C-terminal-containing protein n=1 Tax=Methylobacterium tarhaniae TaxID=1187852 RepID=UPI003D091615
EPAVPPGALVLAGRDREALDAVGRYMRARGFMIGGTAGRTTLNGEGLQHEDGHSHLISATIPNCVSYDPTFSYEVAVIVQDGLRRMYAEQEDVFYYIPVMNENYEHPGMPEGAEAGILKGMYLFREGKAGAKNRVQLMGSGTILREVIAGAELLEQDFGIAADIWSCPSFTELRREAMAVERWNLLHPTETQKKSYVETCLEGRQGPVIAATDYMRLFADQIRPYVPGRYKVLGTDGFGRSDYRVRLREFFEVNRYWVAVAALKSLAEEGAVPAAKVAEAIAKYGLNPEKPAPWTV